MSVDELLHEAELYAGDDLAQHVYDRARDALRAGEDRNTLTEQVTALYRCLGEAGREDDQDGIADVLDALTGFCSPTAAL